MTLLDDLTQRARRDARAIYRDALADGHRETPEACLDFWLDSTEDDSLLDALDCLTADDHRQVGAAFIDAAEDAALFADEEA